VKAKHVVAAEALGVGLRAAHGDAIISVGAAPGTLYVYLRRSLGDALPKTYADHKVVARRVGGVRPARSL
jgi:hypothetical protein